MRKLFTNEKTLEKKNTTKSKITKTNNQRWAFPQYRLKVRQPVTDGLLFCWQLANNSKLKKKWGTKYWQRWVFFCQCNRQVPTDLALTFVTGFFVVVFVLLFLCCCFWGFFSWLIFVCLWFLILLLFHFFVFVCDGFFVFVCSCDFWFAVVLSVVLCCCFFCFQLIFFRFFLGGVRFLICRFIFVFFLFVIMITYYFLISFRVTVEKKQSLALDDNILKKFAWLYFRAF